VTDLRLPSSVEHAPQVSLLKYAGPELSEWRVRWQPPSTQAGGSITLRGRKFGVTFSVVLGVGEIRFDGVVQCCLLAGDGPAAQPSCRVGFKRLPEIRFELGIANKALSPGSDTLRSWLQRQLERWVRAVAVLPQTVSIRLPSRSDRSLALHERADEGERAHGAL